MAEAGLAVRSRGAERSAGCGGEVRGNLHFSIAQRRNANYWSHSRLRSQPAGNQQRFGSREGDLRGASGKGSYRAAANKGARPPGRAARTCHSNHLHFQLSLLFALLAFWFFSPALTLLLLVEFRCEIFRRKSARWFALKIQNQTKAVCPSREIS